MIKFFRKIRLNLLTAHQVGNKDTQVSRSGKYLLYAFGEIALVMIGILLALQVNNWNENRKSEITKDVLLKELKQEFQSNLKLITDHEIGVTRCNDYIIKVLNYSAGKETGMAIDSLRMYASQIVYINSVAITKSYLDGIIASGNIRLLDSELIALLTGFEADFNSFNAVSKDAAQKLGDIEINNLLFNLGFYKPYQALIYPDKPLEIHPALKKNDEEFANYIKDPNTYSLITGLYLRELAGKAWASHLKMKVKNIVSSLEEHQSRK